MAIATFIPEIWSARLLNELQKVHVAANLVNRDYEGEIKGLGACVRINKLLSSDISVWDYERDIEIEAPENLNMNDCTLEINSARYFNFLVDDIDVVQVAGNVMDKAVEVCAHKLKDYSDQYILEAFANGAAEENIIGADLSVTVTKDNVYEYIAQLRELLDKNNAPYEDRAIVVPPEVCTMLMQDTRFIPADGIDERIKTGFIGRAAGTDVYVSNNTVKEDEYYYITAHSKSACTFAEQIIKMDAYRPENTFSDAVKGLYAYGVKVTEPLGVACLCCSIG
ncbi:MAG: hypothetical protein LUE20_04995 [Oscillospiraceae bacterium]|nr:hypothetical protein [Oscillospiraceae bacterium]